MTTFDYDRGATGYTAARNIHHGHVVIAGDQPAIVSDAVNWADGTTSITINGQVFRRFE